jgi:hypothetical protein
LYFSDYKITEHGDCGSWVIDPDDKTLYGYITAGDPGTSIAYIIPAYQAFHEIEQKMGAKVTFPSTESFDGPEAANGYEAAASSSGGKNRYWIPNLDISKKIITQEIQYYLGPESTVRPYTRQVCY